MLQLLQSLFGDTKENGRYPESIVRMAIERTVDGTDPALRSLSSYRKKLRPAVVRAIDHIVALVDGFAPPIDASPSRYSSEPHLKAYFISSNEMQKQISKDPDLAQFLKQSVLKPDRLCALLVMERQERKGFGVDLIGETIQHDVAQTTVSFSDHRLLDPNNDEAETRRMLKRRAFDHLLTLALEKIASVSSEREDLARRHKLMKIKLDLLKRGSWGFDRSAEDSPPDLDELENELSGIEERLLELGGDDRSLETHLQVIKDILAHPEQHLWQKNTQLIVDDMGIKRSQAGKNLSELTLEELFNSAGRNVVVSLIEFSPGEMG